MRWGMDPKDVWVLKDGPGKQRLASAWERNGRWEAMTDMDPVPSTHDTLEDAKRYCVETLIEHRTVCIAEFTEDIKKLEALR